jgi:hypothetical protein
MWEAVNTKEAANTEKTVTTKKTAQYCTGHDTAIRSNPDVHIYLNNVVYRWDYTKYIFN